MGKIIGAKLVAKALKNERAKNIFCLPGAQWSINDACVDEDIRLIDFRHEQGAASASDGYAQASRSPGVCLVNGGPGANNMFPAVAVAYYADSPVIAMTVRTPWRLRDKCCNEEVDDEEWFKPVTKWTRICGETERIPEYLATAFRVATTGRMGPVYLSFPIDSLLTGVDEELAPIVPPEKYRMLGRILGDTDFIKKSIELLLNAERPLIFVSNQIYMYQAEEELQEFVELLQVPVVYDFLGQSAIPDDHPLCAGRAGTLGGPCIELSKADVFMSICARFNESVNWGQPPLFSPDAKFIHIDVDPTEIGRFRSVDVGIQGDPKGVLQQMIMTAKQMLKKRIERPTWLREVDDAKGRITDIFMSDINSLDKPIKPQRLARELNEFIPKDAQVIVGGGDNELFIFSQLKLGNEGHLYMPESWSWAIGNDIPFAIGVKVAKPEKQVFVLSGDGSFLMNGKEVETARRHNIPIVVVIFNNCAWGMINNPALAYYGEARSKKISCSMLSPNTRYDKYAESFDCYGELVTEPTEIKPALKRAVEASDEGKPAVLDVRIELIQLPLHKEWGEFYCNPQFWAKTV